jgi:hypothetical protein
MTIPPRKRKLNENGKSGWLQLEACARRDRAGLEWDAAASIRFRWFWKARVVSHAGFLQETRNLAVPFSERVRGTKISTFLIVPDDHTSQ